MHGERCHDALVVRRYLETFNRIDNHLVEAELPRLDAYIATLDGYYVAGTQYLYLKLM